ncbi:MAG: PKD-like family lipoprotein [Rikenellaceae bacterium]|nr:PKD-like family lipoprotein [Rikenellaceae bacterium]
MIKNIWIIPVVLLTMASCYGDKGNYDYIDIRQAVIEIAAVEEGNGMLVYDQFQELSLMPAVTNSDGGNVADLYDYEWGIISRTQVFPNYIPKKIIGDRKDLSYNIIESPGDYYVTLKATNKTTKAITDYRFDLRVSSTSGWIVLHENASGAADLSIIRDDQIIPGLNAEKHGVLHELFSGVTGHKIDNAKFLAWRSITASGAAFGRLFIYTENGFYALNDQTYELMSSNYASIFTIQPAVLKPQANYAFPYARALEMMLNNGNIYTLAWSTMGTTGIFGNPHTIGTTVQTYEPFLAVIPTTSTGARGVLYNRVNYPEGAFVVINQFANNFSFPSIEGAAFNPNRIGANYHLVYLGTANIHETGAIFRDTADGGKLYMFHANFLTTMLGTPVVIGKYPLSDLPGINNATHFYFSVRGPVMYYASGNKIYSWVFGENTVNEVLTLSAGETVTGMMNYINNNTNATYNGRLLFVSTHNGSEGKVYKIPVNELSGVVNGTVESYGGFGKILDMVLKL